MTHDYVRKGTTSALPHYNGKRLSDCPALPPTDQQWRDVEDARHEVRVAVGDCHLSCPAQLRRAEVKQRSTATPWNPSG
jgi:hypothetical protein